ncbi:MAG: sigma-54-dependent Fis family transcriptional regulator [candidate division WOR-3 bacterium]
MTQDGFKTLYKISQTINSIMDYNELLDRIMDLAIETLSAERGVIVLKEDNKIMPVVAREFSQKDLTDLTEISSSILNQVLQEQRPLLIHNAQETDFSKAQSVILHNIQSVMCVPLIHREKLLGAIYVDARSRKGVFTEEDLEFLEAFSHQAAIAIENARLRKLLLEENQYLKTELTKATQFENIIGRSPQMMKVFDLMRKLLNSNIPVLIQGETGTGKELVARALHYNGIRQKGKFVAIYCGSIPDTLLESELFGYKKGAFTGAVTDKKGLFEEADGGTLFLDEILDVSLAIQAKLLRVLQEGEFRRIGEVTPRRADVRIISATNRSLSQGVKEGKFREDLFFRLQGVTINLPPLRERGDDVLLLANHFLKHFAQIEKKEIKGFTPEAVDLLLKYSWPGNVRELENTIARACALTNQELITVEDLGIRPDLSQENSLKSALSNREREYIIEVLKSVSGNRQRAAEKLGISRRTLQYKLKEYNIKDQELE